MTTQTKCRAENKSTCRTHGDGARQFALDYQTENKSYYIANMTGDKEKLAALRPQIIKLLPKTKAIGFQDFYETASKKLHVNRGYITTAVSQLVSKGEIILVNLSAPALPLMVKAGILDETSTWSRAARIFTDGDLVDVDIREKYTPQMVYTAIKEQAKRENAGIRDTVRNLVARHEAQAAFEKAETSAHPVARSRKVSASQQEADRAALRAITLRIAKEIRENPDSAVARAKRAQDAAIKKAEDERLARGYTQI